MIKRFIPGRVREEQGRSLPKTRLRWLLPVILAVILIYGFAVHTLIPPKKYPFDRSTFPAKVLDSIQGFTFYYLRPGFGTDYTLVPNSVAYQNQVVVFELRNPQGKTLAVTEEATPPAFDTSNLQATNNYLNRYGRAYISDLVDRTTGALFTTDGTWILINAPNPIGAGPMQSIVNNIAPYKG